MDAIKCIIVFGLESSGTRYVSRGIAKLMHPESRWDGERPECYKKGRSAACVSSLLWLVRPEKEYTSPFLPQVLEEAT